ncbi:SanA/YdcF family protein [Halomonas huangheensis]|uniref:DUF218 domain-containing protein n=1 Tax=Halomonas huangheensis TaxID=1178482 RepID=W1N8U0_9GAMM|nr:ElyC/SanA/YdcF family protein [Halomonas huangheensis]ERL51325.1 hypothetical protein BJB45_14125 [Halomonas huangheensis]
MRESLNTYFKRLLLVAGSLVLLLAVILVAANLWVVSSTRERIAALASCPPQRIGVVFGTSHWTRSGERNPHFEGRMQAAAELMRDRRLEHLLVSGDNATRYYNEPITMWRDLRERGVRTVDMTLDYAGFSTFDTLVRARDVFGVEKAVLITQAWHLPRALFIADALGIEAVGCAAPQLPADAMWLLLIREWMARVATIGDLYLWQREPRFLGPKEPLQIVPLIKVAADQPSSGEPLPERGVLVDDLSAGQLEDGPVPLGKLIDPLLTPASRDAGRTKMPESTDEAPEPSLEQDAPAEEPGWWPDQRRRVRD